MVLHRLMSRVLNKIVNSKIRSPNWLYKTNLISLPLFLVTLFGDCKLSLYLLLTAESGIYWLKPIESERMETFE